MRTITENFRIIVSKQKELGYLLPSLLLPAASHEEIRKAEQRIKLKFSSEIIELYSFANGTSGLEYPLGLIGLLPIYFFMSLKDAENYYESCIQFEESFKAWDTNYKPGEKLFPFLQDSSGDCYWVDLNEGSDNYNKVFWTNTYPATPAYQFTSLRTMFETIAEGYQNNIFYLDEEQYLDQDYKAWGLLCKKLNPDVKYWDDYISET